ncbi:hypothetical protein OSTOST_13549, partial [Ostertagia ostertagi]
TGRPHYPVSESRVAILRQRFAREYNVMKLLTRPYVSAEAESDYFASRNVSGLEQLREEEKARAEALRMPGKTLDNQDRTPQLSIRHRLICTDIRGGFLVDSCVDILRNRVS